MSPRVARTLDPLRVPLRGPHLIEASAGTGKTFTIATLFARLVVERDLRVEQILVVTFTEAAAAELRERIRGRLLDISAVLEGQIERCDADAAMRPWFELRRPHRAGDRGRVRRALRSFDEAAISTIHGFCHRVLHDSAFETGVSFKTELIADQQPLLDQAVRDHWTRTLCEADARFVAHALETGLIPPRLLPLARITAAHPGVALVPETSGRARLDPASDDDAAFSAAYARARSAWTEGHAQARALLLEHGGLNKSRYKAAKIEQWFDAAAEFFREPHAGVALGFDGLAKLQASELARSTNKSWQARGGTPPEHPLFDALQTLEQAAEPLRQDLCRRSVAFKRDLVRFVERELPARKQEAGVQSFDDLLHRLARALTHRVGGKQLTAAIGERYHAALIDEFQDTDPVQFRIFDRIFGAGDHPLLLIGDPKQAIYGFRGADVFAYLRAADRVAARRRHTMDTNWRSDPGLLQAVEHLFQTPRPFLLPGIEFVPVKPRPGAADRLRSGERPLSPFEIKVQKRDAAVPLARGQISSEWVSRELPPRVASDIAALLQSDTTLDDRPIRASDIAVLTRTHAQAQAMQAALRELNVPGVVYGDASVYATLEANELERVLAAAAEPTAVRLLRAAVTTELLGVTGGQLEAMADDDEAWDRWVQRFRRWHALWIQRGFIRMLRTLLSDLRLGERLLRLPGGERRMTNLLHLAELLHKAATGEHLGPAGLLHWFSEQRSAEQRLASEAVKLRLERDDEAVQLITVHRSKGLEFPIVYCPYLWSPDELSPAEIEHLKFHDPNDGNRLKIDLSIKPERPRDRTPHPNVEHARFEARAESLRLLYVALTRARHRCVVVWGPFARFHSSALAYLLHGPQAAAAAEHAPAADAVPNVPDAIRRADDDALWAWLQQRKHATWSITELEGGAAPSLRPPDARPDPALRARTARSGIDRLYRTTSFTDLSERLTQTDRAQRPSTEGARTQDLVPLRDFPRGPHVGNFFHHVLEHIPFEGPASTWQPRVDAALRAHGLHAEGRAQLALDALARVLQCPLDASGTRLCDLPSRARVAEMDFTLPVAAAVTDEGGAGRALDTGSLVRAMGSDPTGLPDGYLRHLGALPFVPVRGFLRGFIDLVYRSNRRWYIVDYKTNDLGPRYADYARERLADTMRREHYVLQSHLYTVAACRHLALRIPDFDYDQHFGGVQYLFVRGMDPQRGALTGVYADKPPRARIDAVSDLFAWGTQGPAPKGHNR